MRGTKLFMLNLCSVEKELINYDSRGKKMVILLDDERKGLSIFIKLCTW